MARTKISEFSATAADNTDIDNIDIAEGCAPSGINNAIRELMAQLKDMQTGASGDTFTLTTVNSTTVDTTNLEVTNLKAKDGTAAGSIANSTGIVTFASSVLTTTDINGGTIDGAVIGGSTAAAGTFTTLGATGVATFSAGTVSAPAITTSGDTNTGIFFPAADTIAFAEGGAEAMRIDSSGNVGIGTSSPSVKLDVLVGDGAEATKLRGATGRMRFSPYVDATNGSFIDAVNIAENAYIPLSLAGSSIRLTTNGGLATTIDASGNVGIGTSSPAARLEVATGGDTDMVARAGTTASYASIGARASDYLSLPSFTNTALFQSGSTATGTTAGLSNASLGRLQFINCSAGLIYTNGGSPIVIATNDTERMRIDSSGIVTMSAYGAGAATFSASGVISSVSDETWKTKDGVPTNPDEMLQKLEPGYWFYNEEKAPVFGSERQLGFYAQNVNAAIGDEAAPIPEEGKPWGYYDRSVLAVTVMSLKNALKAIQEQQAIITQLQADVAALKGN